MKIAVFVKKRSLTGDARVDELVRKLEQDGHTPVLMGREGPLPEGSEVLLSLGGDGTFLSAAAFAAKAGIPVLGVNMGRLGFLSEYRAGEAAEALSSGNYVVEDRGVLDASLECGGRTLNFKALNEISVHRTGSAVLGVDVTVDGIALPTYWADGLLVATSSGSTAYSLSVGGPICMPEAKVLIIAPIAPHNLNLRPLIVPDSAQIGISIKTRDGQAMFTADNRSEVIGVSSEISVRLAQFSLKRVRLEKSNFIHALRDKLFWGEDVRNQQ